LRQNRDHSVFLLSVSAFRIPTSEFLSPSQLLCFCLSPYALCSLPHAPSSHFFLFYLQSSSQYQRMPTVPGLPVGRHPDGPLAGNRTLMLANTATDASFRIHIRSLKPYLNLNPASRRRGRFKRRFVLHFQPPLPVADDSSPAAVGSGRYGAVVISGGVFSRFKAGILEFNVLCIGFCDSQF
jgi:hypothetical protein